MYKSNSSELAEGEGSTVTSLGRPGRGEIYFSHKLIHRVSSVEESTVTSLGNSMFAQRAIRYQDLSGKKWINLTGLLRN